MTIDRLTVSFREAARMLGIDRGVTLHALVRSGRLTAIPWGARLRIRVEEIRELARTGFTNEEVGILGHGAVRPHPDDALADTDPIAEAASLTPDDPNDWRG
jgi:hypothetical protein